MKKRKVLLVPFGGVALFLVVAASAWACTLFRGTFTIQGNASSTSVTATGLRTGMVQTVSSGIAQSNRSAGSVTVSAGPDRFGVKLPAGSYQVRYFNGAGYSDHTHWRNDCMAGTPGAVTLGNVTVTSRGAIVGQPLGFSLPASTPTSGGQESAVCISDSFADFGNMAPLTIL